MVSRVFYMLLILPNLFFICCGENEMCENTQSVSNFASYAGIPAFDSSTPDISESLIEMFLSNFTNSVQTSDILKDVFEISQTTPTNFRRFLYDYIKASATNLGMESPHCIANTAAAAVENYFETLEPSVIVKVFGNTVAKLLLSEGLLNSWNAPSFAATYAKALTEIAKKNVKQDNQESKLKALTEGFEKFFRSVNLLVAGKGQKIASTFANEVKLAGLELGHFSSP